MRKLFIIIFFIVQGLYSFSQIEWINYKNSGQFGDAFSVIEFDDNNNPWVGTLMNGIYFFNGSTYRNYNTLNSQIPGNNIYDLLYSSDKQLWIATSNGLALYKENNWTIYTTENSNLPSNTVTSLAKGEGGRIWIGTNKGVVDGLNGNVLNPSNTPMKGQILYSVFTDSKGGTWFATNEEVARFYDNKWRIYNFENSILPSEIALFIQEDKSGIIWVSLGNTYSGTLAAFNGENWSLYTENVIYNLTSRITSIVTLDDGSNWFGTHDKGLIRFKDSVWTAYTTDNSGIPINQIICMKKDRENNLWLGHRNGLTKVLVDKNVNAKNIIQSKWEVFPVPVNEKATIVVPLETNDIYCFEVLSLNGVTLFQKKNITNNFEFIRDDLAPGVYIIKLFNSDHLFQKKVVFM